MTRIAGEGGIVAFGLDPANGDPLIADIDGSRIHVVKEMSTEPPRRIARLAVRVRVEGSAALDEAARAVLVDAALTCPVRLSIHDGIQVPVQFEWL